MMPLSCAVTGMKKLSARQVLPLFPREEAGKAVMNADGTLFAGSNEELSAALTAGTLLFHAGRVGGAWPRIIK